MDDYGIRMTAKDEASPQLEKIRAKFKEIGESTKPLKRKLSEIQKIMGEMNMDGLDKTQLFTEMAQEAGRIKDSIGDAAAAVRAFSNDTMALAAAADAVKLVTGAFSVATSTMSLLGVESEDVKKALLKVQAAMGILNGVQAIANALNKDSALIQRFKAIQLSLTTKETTKNTVATAANTAATVTNTVAQSAWNVAVAIGKALFGDITGLILVAGAGLVSYAMFADSAKDSQEKLNDKLEDAKKRQEDYAQGVASGAASQLIAYKTLQAKWSECNGDVEKQKKFMTEYKDEIKATGLQINSLSDAERLFMTETDGVVAAIMARAKAQAAYNLAVKEMEKWLKEQHNPTLENGGLYTPAQSTSDFTKAEQERLKNAGMDNLPLPSQIKRVNEWRKDVAVDIMRNRDRNFQEIINGYIDDAKKANEEAQKYFKGGGGGGTTTTPKTSTTTKKEMPVMEGSIQDLYNKASNLEKMLKNGLIPKESVEKTKRQIKNLKKTAESMEIQLGLKEPKKEAIAGSYDYFTHEIAKLEEELKLGLVLEADIPKTKKEIEKYKELQKKEAVKIGLVVEAEEGSKTKLEEAKKKIEEQLNNKNLSVNARVKLNADAQNLQRQIDEQTNGKLTIPAEIEPTYIVQGSDEDLRRSYENASKKIQRIMHDKEIQLIDEKEAKRQIDNINNELKKLGLKPIEIHFETNLDKVLDGWKSFKGGIDSIYGMVDAFEQLDGATDKFRATLNLLASIIETVTTLLASYNTLKSLFNAKSIFGAIATKKEAIAEGEKAAAIGTSMAETTAEIAMGTAKETATLAEVAANKALEQSLLDLAAAQIFAAHAYIPFAGVGIANGLVTTMLSFMAGVHTATAGLAAFAEGGIVGGSSMEHHILAHRGEMILNERQQSNLFNAISSGQLGGNDNQTPSLTFRIKGSDLYGALSNYSKIKAKSGKITGIN